MLKTVVRFNIFVETMKKNHKTIKKMGYIYEYKLQMNSIYFK